MKIYNSVYLASLTLVGLFACNQNSSDSKSSDATNEKAGQTQTVKAPQAKTLFTEGKIDIKITTPGSAFGELLQQVDPAKGNVSEQMKALAAKLSPEDKAKIEAQSKQAGIMNMAIMMLPLRSVMYVKGDEATAKFDALTFHGENTVNETKKEGMMYIKSQNRNKAMTISYSGDSFTKMAQNILKAEDYHIQHTGEKSVVAGYNCEKNIYTLKKPVPAEPAPGAIPSASIYQLEVWTSKEMPNAVNFLHPLYIKENAGIMKISILYDKNNPLKLVYEFTKVQDKAVSAAEMHIQKTEKVHDFGKDELTVGMQMMGIVFGM